MSSLLAALTDASQSVSLSVPPAVPPAVPEATSHLVAASAQPSGVPDVGGGEAPPGSDDLLKVLRWVAWTVTALCVAGIFGVAARMAVDHSRGGGREHARGLSFVLGACLLVGAASGIVGALV